MQSYKYDITVHVYYSICSICFRLIRNFFYHLENKQGRTLKENKKQKKRQREESLKSTPSYNRRRVELKTKQQRKITSVELREGLTYQTTFDDTGYSAEFIQEIHPPPLPIQKMLDYTKIYFDPETTG